MAIRKAVELTDADPEFVSIVDKGASRRSWKVLKREEAPPDEDVTAERGLIAGLKARYNMIRKMLMSAGALDEEVQKDAANLAARYADEDHPFTACVNDMKEQGYDDEKAKAICGKMKASMKTGEPIAMVVFDRERFDAETAEAWVTKHDLPVVSLEESETMIRCKVVDVDESTAEFRPETVEPGVGLFYWRAPDASEDTDSTTELASPDDQQVVEAGGEPQGGDGEDAMDLKNISESLAALTTKLDEGLTAFSTRLDAVEASTVKKVEEPVAEAAPEPVVEPDTEPKPDETAVRLDGIASSIEQMTAKIEEGFTALDSRVKKIEGRVVARKGYTETSTMENKDGAGTFRGLFPWDAGRE